jgi:hypothetical protein
MARSARCVVRWGAAAFVGPDETTIHENRSVTDGFRRLLLQIGGANIANADRALSPPTSSSLGDEKRVPSLLLSTAARDPVVSVHGRSGDHPR